ncbi:MAG: hypothetical protein ACW96N_09560 [Candidatus Thorarchaeota archaeon]|jgi:DNA-directed RNA polymerase subunit RPC12/RpoP
MLSFTIESDNLEKVLDGMTSYYSSMYHDFVLIGNQVIAGIIVKEQAPHTITTILRIGEDPSLYNVTIVASGGNWNLFRQRELSQLEIATKDFIENHVKFFKKRDAMDWPCSNCGESYSYPALSADGRYRCPKCASPVDSMAHQ